MTDKVEGRSKAFMDSWHNGDYDGVANTYTEDCVIMAPGQTTISGRDGAKTYFSGLGIDEFELDIKATYGSGDYVVSRGEYTCKKGGEVAETGKYMTVWKEVDGEIYMYNDIWNAN